MQQFRFSDGTLGGARVLRLITLATPHHGSPIANIAEGYPSVWCLTPSNGFLQDLSWDAYDGFLFLLDPCNPWLGSLNISGGAPSYATQACAYQDVPGEDGEFSKIFAYGGETTPLAATLDFVLSNSLLNARGYEHNDGLVPLGSALFDGVSLGAKRTVIAPCNHGQIVGGSCSVIYDNGDIASVFDAVANDLLAALNEDPTPVIMSVSPSVLATEPLPQTQRLTISGSDFAPDATLTFFDGSSHYVGRSPIPPVQPNQLQYDIAAGPYEGAWTVQVVNGTKASNEFPFWVVDTPGNDDTAPPAPIDPQMSPASWGNPILFYLDWANPADPSGVTKVWWKWDSPPTFQGDGIGLALPLFKPLPVAPVTEGARTIYFWLEDGSGNSDFHNWASATAYYDVTAPSLSIDESPDGSPIQIASSQLILHGSATDNLSGVGGISWMSNRGGTGGATGTTNWSTSSILLAPGDNVITVSATDRAGNSASESLTVTSTAQPSACGPWEWDSPVSNVASAAAYGDGKWVAVGYSGAIWTSPDGVTWTPQTSSVAQSLNDVIWTGSQFMAVGNNDTILTSPDGVNWQVVRSSSVFNYYGVAWNGSQYVLVGRGASPTTTSRGWMWTSSDGAVWTQRFYDPDTNYRSPIWSGTLFALLDNKGNVYTSPDGANWTSQNISATGLNDVAWSGTEYLITQGTTVYTSPDAVTWTPHSITPSLSHVIWAGNRFVATSGPQIWSSADGLSWTLETTDGNGDINDLAWSGNQAIAVSGGESFWRQSCTLPAADFRFSPATPLRNQPVAFFDQSTASPTAWSWDFGDGQGSSQQDPTHTYGQGGVYSVSLAATNAFGTDSTQQQITVSLPTSPCSPWEWDAPVASPVNAATYGNGQWVAVGNSGWIGTSPDGVTWTQQTSPVTTKLLDVIWTGSQYMAVGFAGTILTSPDGVTWQASNSISGVYDLYSVVWSGSQYLLVGRLPSTTRSYVWTSSDGHVWAQRLYGPDTTYLHPIWSGTLFVLLDNKGNVSTSPTGANWTTQNISASGLNEVAWSGTEYLITQWTTVYTSPDAVTWTPHSITPSLSHVIWAGNRFIAAGGTGTTQIFSSPDGLNWTLETTDGNGGINDLAWSGNQAVAGAGASFWTQSCTIPTADFRFNPAAPLRNQPVAFFDLSSANPTSWSWDFGDGQGKLPAGSDPHLWPRWRLLGEPRRDQRLRHGQHPAADHRLATDQPVQPLGVGRPGGEPGQRGDLRQWPVGGGGQFRMDRDEPGWGDLDAADESGHDQAARCHLDGQPVHGSRLRRHDPDEPGRSHLASQQQHLRRLRPL